MAAESSDEGQAENYKNKIRCWFYIGIAGSLPDILDPHITLGGRINSYSHMWFFTSIIVFMAILIYIRLRKKKYATVILWCAFAYILHVFADGISGGLDFFNTGQALGGWFIEPMMWPVFDLSCVVIFTLINRRIRRKHGLNPSIVRTLIRKFSKSG